MTKPQDTVQCDAIRVAPPRDYDGIGQALRAAFRQRGSASTTLCDLVERLDRID